MQPLQQQQQLHQQQKLQRQVKWHKLHGGSMGGRGAMNMKEPSAAVEEMKTRSAGGRQTACSVEAYRVAGTEVTLADLEHKIIDTTKDPRVVFGLCKQTVSSPPLVVFSENVNRQLGDVIMYHCRHEVQLNLDSAEIELPRLFIESETGREVLDDFVTHAGIEPQNKNGLIAWVNEYLPQRKKDALLRMAVGGKPVKVSLGLGRIVALYQHSSTLYQSI